MYTVLIFMPMVMGTGRHESHLHHGSHHRLLNRPMEVYENNLGSPVSGHSGLVMWPTIHRRGHQTLPIEYPSESVRRVQYQTLSLFSKGTYGHFEDGNDVGDGHTKT